MNTAVLKLAVEAVKVHERLRQVNLDHVKAACVAQGCYTASEIDTVEDEYRKYIALAASSNLAGLPISRKLDGFWHMHILYTQSYMGMCMEICGRYIHHRPKTLDDADALQRQFAGDTLELYRRNFGEPDPYYWDIVECACCNDCP